jgi:hypothetical protein
MEDKEFKSLKGYIKSRYLYYNQDNEKMIFTQLNSAKKKKNLTYNDIELCLRYIFDCINDKLKPNYLAWGIYYHYGQYIDRISKCKDFCHNKRKFEIEYEIKENKKLTKFDIFVLQKEIEKITKEDKNFEKDIQDIKDFYLLYLIEKNKSNENIIEIINKCKKVSELNDIFKKYNDYIDIIREINKIIDTNKLTVEKYNENNFEKNMYINFLKKYLIELSLYCKNRDNSIKSKQSVIDFLNNYNKKYGIYMLKSKGQIVYIGKASNLSTRPLESIRERNSKNKNSEFYPISEICIYPTKTKSDMHVLEPYLISKYKPIFNSEFMEDENDKVTLFNCDITEKDFESNGIYE